ncbi:MAG: TolC family protein [Bacteroidota bacterium]
MKVKYIILALLLVITNTVFAQDELNRYLEISADNNPELKAKFNEYLAALEVVPQVKSLPDPQLAFAYFIQPVETRLGPQQASFSLTQMFPWFGTLSAREDVAVKNAKARYEAFEDAKSNLFFEVKASYYDLYFIKQAIRITTSNIKLLNTIRDIAIIKVESGSVSAVDQLRVDMELLDLENNLALLKDKWDVNLVKFNKLLNIEKYSEVIIPEELWDDDLAYTKQAVLDSLQQNNHQIKNLDYLIRSYESKEALAKKTGMPNISVGVDYIMIGASDNDMVDPALSGQDAILFPKIGITIPLYRKKYTAMAKEAVLMQEAFENKKLAKTNSLESVFEKVFKEYEDANRRIDLYKKQEILAERAIQMLETEYSTHGKDFEELLRMEKRLLRYSLELEKARSDKQASIAFINYLIGK